MRPLLQVHRGGAYLRRGRTFATNGAILEFEVAGAEIGDELWIESPGVLHIRGRARFDPARDDIQLLELIRDGKPIAAATAQTAPGEISLAPGEISLAPGQISLELDVRVDAPTWFALRASGHKLGELPLRTPWYLRPDALEDGSSAAEATSQRPTDKISVESRMKTRRRRIGWGGALIMG